MSPSRKPSSPSFSGSKSYRALQHGSAADSEDMGWRGDSRKRSDVGLQQEELSEEVYLIIRQEGWGELLEPVEVMSLV